MINDSWKWTSSWGFFSLNQSRELTSHWTSHVPKHHKSMFCFAHVKKRSYDCTEQVYVLYADYCAQCYCVLAISTWSHSILTEIFTSPALLHKGLWMCQWFSLWLLSTLGNDLWGLKSCLQNYVVTVLCHKWLCYTDISMLMGGKKQQRKTWHPIVSFVKGSKVWCCSWFFCSHTHLWWQQGSSLHYEAAGLN